jgi:hypothetical protein
LRWIRSVSKHPQTTKAYKKAVSTGVISGKVWTMMPKRRAGRGEFCERALSMACAAVRRLRDATEYRIAQPRRRGVASDETDKRAHARHGAGTCRRHWLALGQQILPRPGRNQSSRGPKSGLTRRSGTAYRNFGVRACACRRSERR